MISGGNFQEIHDVWSCVDELFLHLCKVFYDEFKLL